MIAQVDIQRKTFTVVDKKKTVGRIEFEIYNLRTEEGLEFFGIDEEFAIRNLPKGTSIYIKTLFIEEEYRGKGNAKKLLEAFIQYSERNYLAAIIVESLLMTKLYVIKEEQERLNKLYEFMGFSYIRKDERTGAALMFRNNKNQ